MSQVQQLQNMLASGALERINSTKPSQKKLQNAMRYHDSGSFASEAPMKASTAFGKQLNPIVNLTRGLFPEANPIGTWLEDAFIGGADEMTGRMAEGYAGEMFPVGPNTPMVDGRVPDLAGVLPLGTAMKGAAGVKAAALGGNALGGVGMAKVYHGSGAKFDNKLPTILKRNDEVINTLGPTRLENAEESTLEVLDDVPNTASISASLSNYEELPGIQQISISEFDAKPTDLFYAKDDIERVKTLAADIKQSGQIKPLIVVQDADGYNILEGAHRLGALHELGETNIPALVVKDLDSLPKD